MKSKFEKLIDAEDDYLSDVFDVSDAPYVSDDASDDNLSSYDKWIEDTLFDVNAAKRIKVKTTFKGQKRFAVYARFSRSTQKQSSIERQNDNCNYYVDLIGGVVLEHFEDRGKSGATMRGRSGLMKMLERLEEFDAIVFEDFDRFSRELYDAVEIYERLEKAGVELHSAIDEQLLRKTDVTQAAARAEHDRIRRRNLTSAGLSQLVREGGIPSGACFGYRDTDTPGFPVPDDDQKVVVIKIMGLAAEGMTFAKIAKKLSDDGDYAPNNTKKWNSSGVAVIVRRPIYTGRIFYRRIITVKDRKSDKVEQYHNVRERIEKNYNKRYRILSDKLFRAANKARKRKGRPGKRSDDLKAVNLFGHAVCDCPGAQEQRYCPGDRLAGRLNCNLAAKRASCLAPVQSLEIEPVERAIVRTLVETSEHAFVQEHFERYYDDRIAEQITLYDGRITATERELDEERALRRRTYDSDLRQMYSAKELVQDRLERASHINELENRLALQIRSKAAVSERAGRSGQISRAFAALDLRLPFRVQNEADAEFLKMFRRLVPEIRIERHGRPRGEISVVMKVVWDALLTNDEAAIAEAPSVTLRADAYLDIKYGLNESAQLSMEEQAAQRLHALTDEQWALVEAILPDTRMTDHHGGRDTTTRTVVDAIVFKMTTRIPIGRLPLSFGPRKTVYNAILRFIYAGGLEKLRMQLEDRYPEMVGGWDFASLSRFRRAEEVAAVPRVVVRPALVAQANVRSGNHRLTEEQWHAVEDLIDDSVKVPVGRQACSIPPRTILELMLLKLRTRCAWRKVPLGEFGYNEFFAAMHRVTYTGTWDRILLVWNRRFPELLEGVDTSVVPSARSRRLGIEGTEAHVRKPEDTLALRIWDPEGRFQKAAADDWMDLTDREWSIVADVLPPLSKRRHRTATNAVLFIMATRTAWQQLPSRYGSRSSIYKVFGRFAKEDRDGSCLIRSIVTALEANSPQTLARMGRAGSAPGTKASIVLPVERLTARPPKARQPTIKTNLKTASNQPSASPAASADNPSVKPSSANQLDLFG
ncbi:transposase [Methylobacterium sp. C25]|uniref:transposase n=1 Tax=Methylobacterium sp. C25 TaxID=2721622 RepID=UPI001F3D72B2|nr:transposase [Methylobacterium sp. C25]MCE4225017.1 transposase [Methylobacterium sp. C25]